MKTQIETIKTAIEANPEVEKLSKLIINLKNQNFYERLGIKTSSTSKEIESIFKELVSLYHPDNKPPELRYIYDQILQLYTEARNSLIHDLKKQNPDQSVQKQKSRQILSLFLNSDSVMAYLNFMSDKTKVTKEGIMTEEEANNIIRPYVAGNTINTLEDYGYESFLNRTKEWEKEGILITYTTEQLQHIKKIVIKEIIKLMKYYIQSNTSNLFKKMTFDDFMFLFMNKHISIVNTEECRELWKQCEDLNKLEKEKRAKYLKETDPSN